MTTTQIRPRLTLADLDHLIHALRFTATNAPHNSTRIEALESLDSRLSDELTRAAQETVQSAPDYEAIKLDAGGN